MVDFGSPFGAYYLGYSAVLDVFSDGSQSLTINNHTLHYMPTVGAIWAEFLVDNLGDNFIVWHNNLPNLVGILETAVICDVVDPVPGVPEPSTWAMMLIGFAGLAFAFRLSRRKDAPAVLEDSVLWLGREGGTRPVSRDGWIGQELRLQLLVVLV